MKFYFNREKLFNAFKSKFLKLSLMDFISYNGASLFVSAFANGEYFYSFIYRGII